MDALELIRKAKETRATTLDLRDCGLTELPHELFELDWLEELDLSSVAVETSLANLFFAIPPEMGMLKNLRVLKLNSSAPENIDGLRNCKNLQVLDLADSGVAKIEALQELTNLTSLKLSYNNIDSMRALEPLINLTELEIVNTDISDFTSIKKFKKLIKLDLSKHSIADGSFLEELSNLQELNLSGNEFSKLFSFAKLTKLVKLDLGSNRIFDLNPLRCLENLRELRLSTNRISNLAPLASLKNLVELALDNNQIVNTEVLAELTNLVDLDLFANRIEHIGPLRHLQNLEYLGLSTNKIIDLTPIESLGSLKRITINSNRISNIQPLSRLPQLSVINVASNQIADISPLSALTGLSELSLSYNNITDISPLVKCSDLTLLRIAKNNISDIEPLRKLDKLRTLDVSQNKITDIRPIKHMIAKGLPFRPVAPMVARMQRDYIVVAGNPLQYPAPEMISQGNEKILQFFDSIEEDATEYLYEAKLLVIGEGGAGKTSLAVKLQNKDAALPEEKDTTKGISIQKLHFTGDNKQDFCINIWDFGGQEIYHATHQFFLTKRSMYILVDDTRKDDKTVNDSSFNFWLQLCELFGGGSPLLIVQNEKGGRSKDLDMKGMQGRFEFIKGKLATNLLTGAGLDKVKKEIEHHVQQLPHVGQPYPLKWAIVRRELETLSHNRDFISLDEYLEICSRNEITNESKAMSLSTLLHDLGILLHFQDNDVLINYVILNSQWATAAVYMILDSEPIKKKNGRFTRADLPVAWADARYKRHYAILLELMTKFELCYELKDAKEPTWLAPQLFPAEEPDDLNWTNANNLVMWYEYDFMPKGLLSRFIVRMHRYVTPVAWKSGVVLERKNTKALVTEVYGSRKIQVNVNGPEAKELMTIISEEFQQMHSLFANLQPTQYVPCICAKCKQNEKPSFYKYDNLLRRKENKVTTIQCDIYFEIVSVDALLNGIFTNVNLDDGGSKRPLKVFISYSQDDVDYKNKLIDHLASLNRTGQIVSWDDQNLIPGEEWDDRIRQEISAADIILLLISPNSINTNYIWDTEIDAADKRARNNERVAIVPVILDFCRWQNLIIAKKNVLPTKGKPITDKGWQNQNEAWLNVIIGIETVIADLSK